MKNRPVHPVVSFFKIVHFMVENNAEFRRGYNASSVSYFGSMYSRCFTRFYNKAVEQELFVPFGCCGCGMHLQVVLARFLSTRITHVRTMVRVLGGAR